jgi:predicted transcriptional regulator
MLFWIGLNTVVILLYLQKVVPIGALSQVRNCENVKITENGHQFIGILMNWKMSISDGQ